MHFPHHGPGGFGMFGGILTQVIASLFVILCFIVVVGLLFVLVRFLLVATRAAELYIANHKPAEPIAPAAAATTTSPVATAPVPRTRSPKSPPTA